MKWIVLLTCCVELIVSAPQGYNYKQPLPFADLVDSSVGGFRPTIGSGVPCHHGPNAGGVVQEQSIGRIINRQHTASDIGRPDSQAVTVNSHIVVGDGGHSHTNVFREGHGYVEQGRPAPLPLVSGPILPALGPAPTFTQTAQQSFGSHNIINGIGKVPPPPQAAGPGYTGPNYAALTAPARRPSFIGAPINPNFIASGSRPSGGSVFDGSSSKFQTIEDFSGSSHVHSSSGGFSHIDSGSHGENSILNGALGNVIRETFANAPLDPTVEKHIYVHVPPEDLEERETHHHIEPAGEVPVKKHYKIIFIKAPTTSSKSTYSQLAHAAGISEEKTIVYVLVKKPEEPSIHEIQQIQQSIKPSKPEVYFIKYKTRKEEAPGGGFIGGDGHLIGGGQFSGSDIDSGHDGRHQTSGSAVLSTSISNSNSIGDSPGAPHPVYGVPNIK